MSPHPPVPLLILNGTVGAGKTAVGTEIADVLTERAIPHAFLDLDALTYLWPPQGRFNDDLAFANLAAVWRNYRDAGAGRLVVARVVETRAGLERFAEAVPGARITVCRITASARERAARLRNRERGPSLVWHLQRSDELEAVLERHAPDDHVVRNENRPLRDVALEVLECARWT